MAPTYESNVAAVLSACRGMQFPGNRGPVFVTSVSEGLSRVLQGLLAENGAVGLIPFWAWEIGLPVPPCALLPFFLPLSAGGRAQRIPQEVSSPRPHPELVSL